MSAAYTLRAVVYGASIIDQLQEINVDPGLTEAMETADSGIDSEFTSVVQQRPVITCSSTAIAKALAVVPIAGLVIDDGTGDPLDFYFAKRAAGSTLDTTNCIRVPGLDRGIRDRGGQSSVLVRRCVGWDERSDFD
jgi:hypothetical protein